MVHHEQPNEESEISASGVVEVRDVQMAEAMTPHGLIQALGTCLRHTSRPWEPSVLAGMCGHAFESTWGLRSAEVWTYGSLEWYHHDRALRSVGLDVSSVDQTAMHPDRPRPSAAERAAALSAAYEAVAASVARGVPALMWQPMTRAQRDAHMGWMWGPVSGVDHDSGEYLVVDRSGSGTYRVHHREVGECDPVGWLSLYTFSEPSKAVDDVRIAGQALAWAVALLSGESSGSEMPARAEDLRHGTSGLSAWAEEVEQSGGAKDGLQGRAGEWAKARAAAVKFCEWAAGVISREVAGAVEEGNAALKAQADALERIAGGDSDSPRFAREAAQATGDGSRGAESRSEGDEYLVNRPGTRAACGSLARIPR